MSVCPKYDEVKPFTEGLAAARDGSRWGYIDGEGQWAIPPQFDEAGPFKNGVAQVWNDTIEIITRRGDVVRNLRNCVVDPPVQFRLIRAKAGAP
jgi:hypothetical protein